MHVHWAGTAALRTLPLVDASDFIYHRGLRDLGRNFQDEPVLVAASVAVALVAIAYAAKEDCGFAVCASGHKSFLGFGGQRNDTISRAREGRRISAAVLLQGSCGFVKDAAVCYVQPQ